MAGAVSSKPKSQPKGPSKLIKLYLLGYNVVQTLGWSYLLYQLGSYFLPGSSATPPKTLWDTVWWTVMIFQNAAVLEILHAATGAVKSSVAVTLMQVYSRVFLVCGIFLTSKPSTEGAGLPLALLAWSITEIIRYSYYAFGLLGLVPHFLSFLRYTLFIILYPIGITGELLCLYHAQNEVAETGKWTMSMPNKFNFIFNYRYFLVGYMLLYIPIFPMLYNHMLIQRKKVLGGGSDKKTK